MGLNSKLKTVLTSATGFVTSCTVENGVTQLSVFF